eukprot:6198454-Amphidinium_carterae.1
MCMTEHANLTNADHDDCKKSLWPSNEGNVFPSTCSMTCVEQSTHGIGEQSLTRAWNALHQV